jgi:hypothetical protein
MGRIHYESSRAVGDVQVLISDPVAHVQYSYEVNPAATGPLTAQSCTQPLMSQISQPTPPADPNASSVTPATSASTPAITPTPLPPAVQQDLGVRTIEGMPANGKSRTDYLDLQPGIKTMLTVDWFSPDLGVNLREFSNYSGQNQYSVDTHNIQPGDPDPNLFALPAGYTISNPAASCIPTIS